MCTELQKIRFCNYCLRNAALLHFQSQKIGHAWVVTCNYDIQNTGCKIAVWATLAANLYFSYILGLRYFKIIMNFKYFPESKTTSLILSSLGKKIKEDVINLLSVTECFVTHKSKIELAVSLHFMLKLSALVLGAEMKGYLSSSNFWTLFKWSRLWGVHCVQSMAGRLECSGMFYNV